VNFTDLGLGTIPASCRLINDGTSDIWVVFSTLPGQVAAFPTPGTLTTGTATKGFRLKPGAIETFSLNQFVAGPSSGVPGSGVPSVTAGNPNGPGVYIATIAGAAGQQLSVSFGEGA
jgi:hypothetical protein